jgi:pantothenate kinase-related protein Tda10
VYKRNLYVEKITPFLGRPVVKVITGMRRSGKSCLVRLLMDKLVADGVKRRQIVYVDKQYRPVKHPTEFRSQLPVNELKELCIVVDFNLDPDSFHCLADVTKRLSAV